MAKGPFLRKYGVETTVPFDLFEVDGVDLRVDAAHAAGDTKIMKDEGAEANTSNGFTDEGQSYSIVLTATEMEAARIKVLIVDAATKVWLDTSIVVETYGHASAMHAFDLDTSSVAQTGDTFALANGAVGFAAIAAFLDTEIAAILADTGELQTDWTDGGRLDLLLDAIKAITDQFVFTVANQVDANMLGLAGSDPAAEHLRDNALTGVPVTFSAGGSTTTAVFNLVDGAAASTDDDFYNDAVLIFNLSTLKHVRAEITDYDGATKTATISAVPFAPGAGHTARLY